MVIVKETGNELLTIKTTKTQKHIKCLEEYDYWGEFDCGYTTVLICEECKYEVGRKDPEAKRNRS